ncbi:hypothetical protein [Rubrivivax sp. JA1026]|uniref:hypothetical protein n=1 Tax=Rubrivivax sp. JA1026 TaxID=2710888 RepID=UPI0013E96BB6|nr:hypothetical protein [Rubrivivax sp. JA1026]
MSNVLNALHAAGINPFAVTLVAESLLKSPIAARSANEPLDFFFPVKREDCAGFIGVSFTLQAVEASSAETQPTPAPAPAEPVAPPVAWPHDATDRVHQLMGQLAEKELQRMALHDGLRRLLCAVNAQAATLDERTAAQALLSASDAAKLTRRVYLVATGSVHEGQETYTRHDDAPPPLCDAECLYAAPATTAQAEPVADERPTRDDLIAALSFYAKGEHFVMSDSGAWDTVSGEPQNWYCDEAGTAMVEDGTIASRTLDGQLTAQDIAAMDDEDGSATGEGV